MISNLQTIRLEIDEEMNSKENTTLKISVALLAMFYFGNMNTHYSNISAIGFILLFFYCIGISYFSKYLYNSHFISSGWTCFRTRFSLSIWILLRFIQFYIFLPCSSIFFRKRTFNNPKADLQKNNLKNYKLVSTIFYSGQHLYFACSTG